MAKKFLCCSLVGWSCMTLAWPQGLAEVAEKEKERRARQKDESVREYTDKDLENVKQEEEADSEHSRPAEAEASSERAEGVESARNEEESWRERMRSAREAVSESKKSAAAIEKKLAEIGMQRLGSTDMMVILSLQEEERRLQKELAQAQKEVTAQEKRLLELESVAKKSRIPPGWLRE
ncbi:MAG: hypothetical protein JXO72_16695 [Vicinamibacteria bacterium]|nr:hypothetical protein [Vicinamibacteria bacterium]